MNPLLAEAKQKTDALIANHRWLHSHAEVGFDLKNTVAFVENKLKEMGYTPVRCGKSGIVASIGSGNKTILLRADMDALPIREETGLPFSCENGNMHACGHDMHTTMLLGAAELLMKHKENLKGTVKLMFQPAEEMLSGANDMLDAGVLENPTVDAAVMIHVTTGTPMPTGTVYVPSTGVSSPAADYFTIQVQGVGCHGSTPEKGVDAVTAAAHILVALQEIRARELPAGQEAIFTVGSFHGGTAANVIADTATLEGTIRAYDEETRAFLKMRISEIAQSTASAFRASATVTFGSGCPPMFNHKDLTEKAVDILKPLLGESGVINGAQFAAQGRPVRSGGSEDFAYISQKIPSMMLALAAGTPDEGHTHPLHHPKVTFNESVLPIGAAVFAHFALTWLSESYGGNH